MAGTAAKACSFCEIVRGERSAVVVFQDRLVLAFLDHRPLFPGHLLLVPRDHIETLPDLPPALLEPFFSAAQLLTRALEEGLGAEGVFAAMNNRVSQSVPHLHLHLVPRHKGDGLRGFFWPRHRYPDEASMHEVAERLAQTVARLGGSGGVST
jgi:histidine triad (HIT) family protein